MPALKQALDMSVSIMDVPMDSVLDVAPDQFLTRITAKEYFGPGLTEVRSDFKPLLDRIGNILAKDLKSLSGDHFDLNRNGRYDPEDYQLRNW